MSGDTSNDPFVAYQKAAKSMSAKKGSASRTISGDDLMITGSRQATAVKVEPSVLTRARKARGGGVATRASYQSAEVVRSAGNLAAALSNLNLQVFPHDGTSLPSGEPLEVIQVLQGGLLRVCCYESDFFPFRLFDRLMWFRVEHLPATSPWGAAFS